jgi:hypothetical protein
MKIIPGNSNNFLSDKINNSTTRRRAKEADERKQVSEGFLPVKSHPIGDEISHYYVDSTGEVPERIHYEVRDANEPLPFERVRQLLNEIKQDMNLESADMLKAQQAPVPETVLKLLS